MKLKPILMCSVALSAVTVTNVKAADYIEPVKPITYNNPIIPFNMCADPTAVEYEGRLYVYGTNDQQEFNSTKGETNNTYGTIKSLVVMSTADMINWTYHGTIDMKAVCGSWMWASWAPSIVSRVEADGLTHFYMYFSNSGGGVGVITSTSPIGPWTSPLNQSLISGSTPGLGECRCPFDPGVVIDDNGVGWLSFGGGDPVSTGTKLQPGNARIVKLGDDMISLASDIVKIDAPYHFEANELNYVGGKYVYTYCTGWSDRNDWAQYSTTAPAPSTASMCYMVSDNPLDPSSWKWGGEVLKNPASFGYPGGNNHTHMHKFCDNYYYIYHTQVMEQLMKYSGGGYRSLAVNAATVNEETQEISPVKATNSGAPIIRENRMDPFERQQAETMWNCAGITFAAGKGDNNLDVTGIQTGGWIGVKTVNFGDREASTFTLKVRGKGHMEIRIRKIDTEPVASFDFSTSKLEDQTFKLDKPITGVQTLYFVFGETSSTTRIDEWQFGEGESGITGIEAEKCVAAHEYYTLSGIRIERPGTGITLHRIIYTDGTSTTEKICQ